MVETKGLAKRLKKAVTMWSARKDCHLDTMIIILMITVTISVVLLLYGMPKEINAISKGSRDEYALNRKCSCSDVFDYVIKGAWVSNPSCDQQGSLDDAALRRKLKLPEKMYREDIRCGINYPIANLTLPSSCQHDGEHYCCNEQTGWCGNSSLHCTHSKSTNYRELIPNNKAYWKAEEGSCKMAEIAREEACDILKENGYNIIFIGDSEARKFLASFLLFLSGNFSHGIINRELLPQVKQYCHGELQFLDSSCRHVTYYSSIQMDNTGACDFERDFLLEYFADFNTFVTRRTEKRIRSLFNITNSFIIMNSGSHFNAQKTSFMDYYLKYITNILKDVEWPKIIVETLPKVPSVAISDRRGSFRDEVKKFCQDNKLLLLDNYDLSHKLRPYDGKHYRLNFYLLKVQILLNFLKKQAEIC